MQTYKRSKKKTLQIKSQSRDYAESQDKCLQLHVAHIKSHTS